MRVRDNFNSFTSYQPNIKQLTAHIKIHTIITWYVLLDKFFFICLHTIL